MIFAKQADFFDNTYYTAYSEGVHNTSMEPQKEQNAARVDWGDIHTRLTETEASVTVEDLSAQYPAPLAPQMETDTH